MAKFMNGVFECTKCKRKFYWQLPMEMDKAFPCPVCHDVFVTLIGFMQDGSVNWAKRRVKEESEGPQSLTSKARNE